MQGQGEPAHFLAELGGAAFALSLLTLRLHAFHQSPSERSDLLISSSELASVHHKTASSGQTPTPNLEDSVSLHYAAFVVAPSGQLLELDGGRGGPISHGAVKVGLLEVS